MRRLKTIDEIYEEVRGCGLVITNDISLETALNSRISEPRIGPLAKTPMHIAQILAPAILGRSTMTDLELIAAVSEETGYGFRHVYSEILNIREIRRHTEDVAGALTGRSARNIWESYSRMPTLENAMAALDVEDPRVSWYFEKPGGVAVVGLDLFNDLDKHCVPFDFQDVDIFTDGEFEMGEIRIVGNDRLLAENAVDLVDREHASDYAIVMSSSSPIADAVRSALYRRRLPFVNSLTVRDLAPIRDYLSFLTLSLSYSTLRVKAVKELFSTYGGTFSPRRDGYLLSRQTDEDMRERSAQLRNVMRSVAEDGMTFGEVADEIVSNKDRGLLSMLLDELDVGDRIVTPERVSEVRFAVDNVQELKHNEQIPDDEKTGVLLADCRNSVFVDKPVVIYLGLGQDWTIPVVGRRYIDAERESEVNAMRLEALVQQGQRRVYCANAVKAGKPAAPCMTFDTLVGRPVERFEDLAPSVIRGRWAPAREEAVHGVDAAASDRPADILFTKSSFNAYAACPRRFLFHLTLKTPDRTYTEFGNLVHEFAELYACYPDLVRERGVDDFVNMVSDRYSGLSTPLMEKLDSERIRVAMVNTMRYLDMAGVRAPLNVPCASKSHPNRFMQELGLEMTSDVCEGDHRSSRHPMHGIFDLLWNGDVTDYKTGKAKDGKRMAAAMSLDEVDDYSEFQPMIYLALASEAEGASPVFRQFYALDNDIVSSDESFDVSRNVRTVSLCAGGLEDALSSPRFLEFYESKLPKAMKGRAKAIVDALTPIPPNPDGWKDDPVLQLCVLQACGMGDNKTNRTAASGALRNLALLVKGGMTFSDSDVCIPVGMLDRFLDELDGMHAEMVERMETGLPAVPNGKVNCMNCTYFQACTRSSEAAEEGGDDE
ncbi:MAG: PD-(D/E)XK nuclease family protein [Thermoplasmata archaeon]|nr:PD-(D/E)XK nuclease family protein [Thermoplasmata archaeon]